MADPYLLKDGTRRGYCVECGWFYRLDHAYIKDSSGRYFCPVHRNRFLRLQPRKLTKKRELKIVRY